MAFQIYLEWKLQEKLEQTKAPAILIVSNWWSLEHRIQRQLPQQAGETNTGELLFNGHRQ
jgi:hypothetical protein